jgi:hypothetical protein
MDEEYYNWIHNSVWTEDDAREAGYRAYQNDLSRNDNPFNNNDEWDLHLAWEEGRSQAAWDD